MCKLRAHEVLLALLLYLLCGSSLAASSSSSGHKSSETPGPQLIQSRPLPSTTKIGQESYLVLADGTLAAVVQPKQQTALSLASVNPNNSAIAEPNKSNSVPKPAATVLSTNSASSGKLLLKLNTTLPGKSNSSAATYKHKTSSNSNTKGATMGAKSNDSSSSYKSNGTKTAVASAAKPTSSNYTKSTNSSGKLYSANNIIATNGSKSGYYKLNSTSTQLNNSGKAWKTGWSSKHTSTSRSSMAGSSVGINIHKQNASNASSSSSTATMAANIPVAAITNAASRPAHQQLDAASHTAGSTVTAAALDDAASILPSPVSADAAATAAATISAALSSVVAINNDSTVSVNETVTGAISADSTSVAGNGSNAQELNANIAVSQLVNGSDSLSAAVGIAAEPPVNLTMFYSSKSCGPIHYKPPPRGNPATPLIIRGGRLVSRRTGTPVPIHGLNWFGFNVDMGMVDGLWAGGTDAATDFNKIAYQIRLLGYNAIRLPFAHKYLAKNDTWDLVRECTTLGANALKDRLVAPEDATSAILRRQLPRNPSPMKNDPGKCNTYLPTSNNKDRLLFAVQQFIALGFYVVLDYQPQGLEQQAYNLNEFVDAWKGIWKQVTCLSNFNSDIAGRVLIDVMNEPDSMSIRWEASGDRPGAEQLYLATADALWEMSPNQMLFMFEGTGQNMFGLNWGNGFITDEDIIASRGLSNPNSFFRQLVTKPYAKKTLISPHLYPPSITKSTWLGEELWKQSNTSFGYLQTTGYCIPNGACTKFPVLVGETGSAYTEEDDKKWLEDFAAFANAQGDARKYTSIPLAGWMWWAYNENSGDTGGIVHNNWQDFNWAKLRYMMNSLGLKPWYKQRATTPSPPNRPVNPPQPPRRRRPNPPSRQGPTDPSDPPAGQQPHHSPAPPRRHRRNPDESPQRNPSERPRRNRDRPPSRRRRDRRDHVGSDAVSARLFRRQGGHSRPTVDLEVLFS